MSVSDFIKVSTAIIGPGEAIVIPPADDVIVRRAGGAAQFAEDGFAVELRGGVRRRDRLPGEKRDQEDALDHVFGYTVFDDVGSARCSSTTASATSARTSTRSAPWGRAS